MTHSEENWANVFVIDSSNGESYIFFDGSKVIGAGAGFFCINPYSDCSFKLNDYSSIFQADIVGITEDTKRASGLTSKYINLLVKRKLKLYLASLR